MLGYSNKNYNLSLTSLSVFPLPVLFAVLNYFNRQWNVINFSTPLQFHFSTKKKNYFMVIPRWMSGKQLANRGPGKLKRDFGAKSTCSQAKKKITSSPSKNYLPHCHSCWKVEWYFHKLIKKIPVHKCLEIRWKTVHFCIHNFCV